MAIGDSSRGIYDHLYRRFFANRDRHEGYDFQHAPSGSAQLPAVTFQDKLRWWYIGSLATSEKDLDRAGSAPARDHRHEEGMTADKSHH